MRVAQQMNPTPIQDLNTSLQLQTCFTTDVVQNATEQKLLLLYQLMTDDDESWMQSSDSEVILTQERRWKYVNGGMQELVAKLIKKSNISKRLDGTEDNVSVGYSNNNLVSDKEQITSDSSALNIRIFYV